MSKWSVRDVLEYAQELRDPFEKAAEDNPMQQKLDEIKKAVREKLNKGEINL